MPLWWVWCCQIRCFPPVFQGKMYLQFVLDRFRVHLTEKWFQSSRKGNNWSHFMFFLKIGRLVHHHEQRTPDVYCFWLCIVIKFPLSCTFKSQTFPFCEYCRKTLFFGVSFGMSMKQPLWHVFHEQVWYITSTSRGLHLFIVFFVWGSLSDEGWYQELWAAQR